MSIFLDILKYVPKCLIPLLLNTEEHKFLTFKKLQQMDTQFIENAIDSFEGFVAAIGYDVASECEEDGEYIVFSGQVATDKKGNVKTYALINDNSAEGEEPKKVLVSQVPLRTILHKGAEFLKSMVYLYKADESERAKKAEEEAKAEAEADEAENEKIDNRITDLQSEISSLKLKKKSVRHYYKRP